MRCSRELKAASRARRGRRPPVAGRSHFAVQDLNGHRPPWSSSLTTICRWRPLLKSPVFGFSEDDLFRAGRRTGLPNSRFLSRLGEDPLAPRNPDWTLASEMLGTWRNEAGYVSPFAFYARILGRDGVRARMIAAAGNRGG